MEKTLVLIKPDAFRKHYSGDIIKHYENEGLKILDTEYAVEDYAIAISKDNPELLEKVNNALAELTEDGTIANIINKYIPSAAE